MEIVDPFGFLLGAWHVKRALTDHRGQTRGSFAGTAALRERALADDAPQRRARYEEVGELHVGAYVGHAERRLDYLGADDATVTLAFTDGRPFVDVDLRSGAWRGLHLCGEDRYELSIVVRSRDLLEERWRVEGPATDYDAVTVLRRVR